MEVTNWSRAAVVFFSVLLGIWIIYSLNNILLLIALAALMSYIFSPLVNLLVRWGSPRLVALLISYLVGLLIISLLIFLIIPPLAKQFVSFTANLPTYLNGLQRLYLDMLQRLNIEPRQFLSSSQIVTRLTGILSNLMQQALAGVLGIAGLVIIPILSFFMLLSGPAMWNAFTYILPEKQKDEIIDLAVTTNNLLGNYIVGHLLLITSIGFLTSIGLLIMGVPFALVLGLIAAVLEVVPNLGPIIAAVPAILLAFSSKGWAFALGVAGFYVFVQIIESYVLAPTILGRSVGLDPLTIILAVMVGGHYAGILGVLVAIPASAVLKPIIIHYVRKYKDGHTSTGNKPNQTPDSETLNAEQ
ncbi:MAG: AI-2E family transporter [bacterium]|nr:AI-2E family transporter [bacterium]